MSHQYGRTALDAIGELMQEIESLKSQIDEEWRERAHADAILEQSSRLMGCSTGTLADRIHANGRYWAELVRQHERYQAAKAMEPTLTLGDESLAEAIVEYGRRREEEGRRG